MDLLMISAGIALAAVVSFVIGGIWYSPSVFGSYCPHQNAVADKNSPTFKADMQKALIVTFLFGVIKAAVMVCFMYRIGITSVTSGALFGLTAWFGFSNSTAISAVLWDKKPFISYVIATAHNAVSYTVTGALLALFI